MSKYAVVTGASSGIGLEFAKLLAADGYDLLLAARDKGSLRAVANELESKHGTKANILAIDLGARGSASKLWDAAKEKPVDILINNAGFGDLSPVVDGEWEKLSAMIELNITTLTHLSKLAASSMGKVGKGRILNVASIAAFFPGPGMAVYYATKAYVLSFSEALSVELASSGVTVTALCPGPTKTKFSEAAGADKSGLFKGNLPTAKEVASYGYAAMRRGKVVAVHGIKNKLYAHIVPRILPRQTVRKIINNMQN